MIVVDSSAIVAIWKNEPSAEALAIRLTEESQAERRISAATYVEVGAVLAGTKPDDPREAVRRFNRWIAYMFIEIVAVDAGQASIALAARIRFGRGFRTAAKLNLGDCFSYALAKTLSAPLLYVGDDFAKTDIVSALTGKRRSKKDQKP